MNKFMNWNDVENENSSTGSGKVSMDDYHEVAAGAF